MCALYFAPSQYIVDKTEKNEAAQDLVSNLEKINYHGKRAANIINQLQEHARLGTAQQFFEEENNNL